MIKLFLVFIFICVLLAVESLYYLIKDRVGAAKQARKRLRSALNAGASDAEDRSSLLVSRTLSDIPWLNQLLTLHRSVFQRVETLLKGANSNWTVGYLFLTSLLILASAWVVCHLVFERNVFISVVISLTAGSLPFFWLYRKRQAREVAFAEQLPDVLDLMARALRAGNSVSGAIQCAGHESPDPAGPELTRVFEEVNYGRGVTTALQNLAKRMQCDDLRYLVVALVIQQETGGNLNMLFDRLAHIIRERVKLVGQIQALTAEGRLSGTILTALPLVLVATLYWVQPEYLMTLFTDPMGQKMVAGAIGLQVIGYLVIRRLVNMETL